LGERGTYCAEEQVNGTNVSRSAKKKGRKREIIMSEVKRKRRKRVNPKKEKVPGTGS